MYNPLQRWSRLCVVPENLKAVTQIGDEVTDRHAGLHPGSAEALWQIIERLYARGVQPGLQMCVQHQGQRVLNRALGHAQGNAPGEKSDQPVPMLLNTPVSLFSAGKAVTAMLVHKLQELGKLDIDEPVAAYIPGFERHGKGNISIRQVMTHRAGLAQLPVPVLQAWNDGLLARPEAIIELMINAKPQRRAGGAPGYHAITGGNILAEVMRGATGRDPRELLQALIKQPLKLGWLDYGVSDAGLPKVAHNAVTGYTPAPIAWKLGRVIGGSFADVVDISNQPAFLKALLPSVNVLSTAQDMARLYQCLLNGGALDGVQVFAPETVTRAIAPDTPRGTLDRTIGIPIRYSAGFMVGHRGLGLYGLSRYSTFGHLGLSSTLTWARPDTGTVIALLTTGKPILGPHIAEMIAMFRGLNALCENRIA